MNEKTKSLILIGGAIALAIVFIAFGAGKFIDPPKWEAKFEAWGLPIWLFAISGVIEIVGGLALFLPVLRGLSAIGLALFMIGAVMTHIVHVEITMIFVAGAILAASAALGWARFPETVSYARRKLIGDSNNPA